MDEVVIGGDFISLSVSEVIEWNKLVGAYL